MIRVIYIAGAARSGSTVLDTVLGNHPNVASFGELVNLPKSGWINNEYCACYQRVCACPFWSEVRAQWEMYEGKVDVKQYVAAQDRFTRIRSLPRLLRERFNPSPSFQRYKNQTYSLFKVIRAVSGRSVLVDSSKRPVRAYVLSLIPGIDLRVIQLVRDGRGVLWSLKKRYAKDEEAGVQHAIVPQPTWRVAASWIATNLLAACVRRWVRPGYSALVRYEDFVGNPERVLCRVGETVGLDLGQVGTQLAAGMPMKVGHSVAGNRVRMTGHIRLCPDVEWIEKLDAANRRLFWALTGWLMQGYGYMR